jgi:hypothetical protein
LELTMLSFNDLPVPPVWAVAALLLAAAGLGTFLTAVRLRARLWAIPALLAALTTTALFFTGPQVQPPTKGAPLQNYSPQANFKDRYEQDRSLYGETIGACYQRRELLVCPTVYAFMEFHPGQLDPKYLIEHANLGDELRIKRGLPRDPDPVLPPIVITYLADQKNRSVDYLYWIGYPITNPREVGQRTEQYFDKIVLSWPTGSTEPADVRREPVGSQMWTIERTDVDPASPDPWTVTRRWLIAASALLLLLSALPVLLPRVFIRRFAPGESPL